MSGDAPALLVEVLGHEFRDPALLDLALSHSSYAHEMDGGRGNERLEFLGDAVLGAVVAELLFDAHPDWSEGELTRTRAALVNGGTLAACAREIGLGRFIKLGRTERVAHGEEKDSILANCFEAVMGALYLDAGLAPAAALARRVYARSLQEGSRGAGRDPKTAFQEWAHAHHRVTPRYRTVCDSGTDDDDRRFTVEVLLGVETFGEGVGRSKRLAERAAAQQALDAVMGEPSGQESGEIDV